MRILLTNLFLQGHTGSESFIYTLGKEFRELGHDITFFVHNWGWFGEQVKAEGFECWYAPPNKPFKLPCINFDFVHFQHNETVRAIYPQVKHIPKSFICHGMLPAPEQPLPFTEYPMEAYFGISEETLHNVLEKAYLKNKFPPISIPPNQHQGVVRNLIDIEKFKAKTSINQKLKNVLIISNYIQRQPRYVELIKKACETKKLNLEIIGDAGKRVPDTRPYIEKANLVIGLGRCAYESMAMARSVLVFDYQGFEGLITSEQDYLTFRKYNLSGRCKKKTEVYLEDVIQAFNNYSASQGTQNRQYIEKYHDSKTIAKEYETAIKFITSLPHARTS